MPAHPELRLIAKIIAQRDFKSVVKSKITSKLFSEPEARAMFEYLWQYYFSQRHPGSIPTRMHMKEKFPTFDPKLGKDAESALEACDRVKTLYLSTQLSRLNDEIATMAMSDPRKALERMRSGMLKLQSVSSSSRDVILSDVADELIREYDAVKNAEGVIGVPWPWKELNERTGGMKDEDFILIYGRLKSMKSFMAILVGVYAYMLYKRRVMFYTAEMSPMLVAKRAAACVCGLNYDKVRRATLSPGKEEAFKQEIRSLAQEDRAAAKHGVEPAFMIASDKDDPRGVGGIGHVEAKAEEFEPDLIIVDSFYRMRDDRSGRVDYDWKVQAALSQDLKSMAQRLQVPVIGVTQANRKSDKMSMQEGMEDVAFADAGGQETDFGLRIVKGRKNPEFAYAHDIYAIVAAAREMEQSGFRLSFKPFVRYKFMNWLDEQDIVDVQATEKAQHKRKQEDGGRSKAEVRSDEAWLNKKRGKVEPDDE